MGGISFTQVAQEPLWNAISTNGPTLDFLYHIEAPDCSFEVPLVDHVAWMTTIQRGGGNKDGSSGKMAVSGGIH